MGKCKDFIKDTARQVWGGFLKNLGVVISAFIFSGGYLVAINKIKQFQLWVRAIPTDYVLTPAVLLFVGLILLVRINRKQRQRLSQLQTEPDKDEREARFVTHLGVWWKLYPDSEYIEDFPYCPCCEPHMKLVQTEWHPEEKYKCPKTNTEYKLYDKLPRERDAVLENLYSVYFGSLGRHFERRYFGEFRKIKDLNPGMSNREISERLFQLEPLRRIPPPEIKEILDKNDNPINAFHFIQRNFVAYKKYLRERPKDETTKP